MVSPCPPTPQSLWLCMQTPQPLHVDGEQWLPTMSPCHRNSSTAEGSHLRPLSPWGSRPAPPRGTGALRAQAPSRKGTLRSAPQTFPATLAWPSRGLYLDLQEEKPGERRLATFQPCLELPFPCWEGGSETRCPSHPPLSLSSQRWVRGHRGSGGCCHLRPQALQECLPPIPGCLPRRGVRRVLTALNTPR